MKYLEEMESGSIVHEISAADLLQSTGVLLAKWASDLLYTDAAYGEGYLLEATEIMATTSEMLHVLFEAHYEILRNLNVVAPEGVVGVAVVNPFQRNSMSGEEESDDPSTPTDLGGTPNIDDIPF